MMTADALSRDEVNDLCGPGEWPGPENPPSRCSFADSRFPQSDERVCNLPGAGAVIAYSGTACLHSCDGTEAAVSETVK